MLRTTAGLLALSAIVALSACDNRNRSDQNAGRAVDAPQTATHDKVSTTDGSKTTETYTNQSPGISADRSDKGTGEIVTQKQTVKTETEKEKIPTVEEKNIKADINRLSADELHKMGLSEQTANNVVKYRDDHGGKFSSLDQLRQVPGMDLSWLTKNRAKLGIAESDRG